MNESHQIDRGDGWITTYTGQHFYPLDPRPHEVNMLDIAHALSMICRFNGHTQFFYSVAEHSIRCAYHAHEQWPDRIELQLAALLHDASEAYLCDIPRPVKLQLPDYRAG